AADARLEGAKDRMAVDAETAAAEKSIKSQQEAQKRAVEQAGAQEAVRGMTQAEIDARRDVEQAKVEERQEISAATGEFVDAVGEHQAAVQEASAEQAEADRIRARADRLTNDADLP
ncbi:MAG TPA: CsbD family protein, partial [Mycobacterium sp.]|nr:CsbD family protein [Mycobacterium sp.]